MVLFAESTIAVCAERGFQGDLRKALVRVALGNIKLEFRFTNPIDLSGNASIEEASTILGISVPFSEEQLKEAYRLKVREWHPDSQGDRTDESLAYAHEQMVKINSAYSCLNAHFALEGLA